MVALEHDCVHTSGMQINVKLRVVLEGIAVIDHGHILLHHSSAKLSYIAKHVSKDYPTICRSEAISVNVYLSYDSIAFHTDPSQGHVGPSVTVLTRRSLPL